MKSPQSLVVRNIAPIFRRSSGSVKTGFSSLQGGVTVSSPFALTAAAVAKWERAMNYPRGSFVCCALLVSIAIFFIAQIAFNEISAASTLTPTVRIFDDRLVPAVVQIPPLSSVTWINNGHRTHVVRSTNGGWQTFSLQARASRRVTFRTTGEFPYKVDGVLSGFVLVAAVHLGDLSPSCSNWLDC